jgi:hypothetical protein
VQQVHFDFRNGRAKGRSADIDGPEQSLARVIDREGTAQYTLDDVDVCPSAVQRTLEIDLSALEKGH